MDSEGNPNLAEGVAGEAFAHAMTDNDEVHVAAKEIVATDNENVVEHVSHTTTHG